MTAALGISAYYHDAAACLVVDGELVAAAEEERFSRRKHDPRFPERAIAYCLSEVPGLQRLDAVVFYEKPLRRLSRVLESFLAVAPRGGRAFARAVPRLLRSKLLPGLEAERLFARLGVRAPPLSFVEHHEAHAASAFLPSGFDEAAILTLDGVGEWATTTLGVGRGADVELVSELRFPHSLGLFYAAFTAFCGFSVNSDEYKLMGLAPYGEPRFVDAIRRELIDVRPDGSFRLALEHFGFLDDERMTAAGFERLFGGPARVRGAPIGQREKDLARSAQAVLEDVVLALARTLREQTGLPRLCMAGGVALNAVANGRLAASGTFDELFVQPAAGDSGGAVGAALLGWHRLLGHPLPLPARERMRGALLGPSFPDDHVRALLVDRGVAFEPLAPDAWAERVAACLEAGEVVALFSGRMELGPRALGARSILADPRRPDMQARINRTVKRREDFRPFAPACLAEHASELFELSCESPYMLLVFPVRPHHRGSLPAVTHVDGSARVQTVTAERSPDLHRVLQAFHARTGCPLLLQTSFNVNDEPIVATPDDALACFLGTDLDRLVIGPFLVSRP